MPRAADPSTIRSQVEIALEAMSGECSCSADCDKERDYVRGVLQRLLSLMDSREKPNEPV